MMLLFAQLSSKPIHHSNKKPILNLEYKVFPLKFMEFGLSTLFWTFGILNNIVTSTDGKMDEEQCQNVKIMLLLPLCHHTTQIL